MFQPSPLPRFLIVFAACFAMTMVAAGVQGEEAIENVAADSTWITSIAKLGDSGACVASTASGLLLQESAVVSFDVDQPTELKTLYTHPAAAWCVTTSRDGEAVFSADYRGNLVVYDRASDQAKTYPEALQRWCQALIVAPDQKSLVAGNESGHVLVWDLADEKVVKTIELDGHAVTSIAFSPDQSRLAVADGGGHVHWLAWPSLESQGKSEISDEPVWCVAFAEGSVASAEGSEQLLLGSGDRHLYRMDASPQGQPQSVLQGSDWITELAVAADGTIAAGEVSGKVHLAQLAESNSQAIAAPSGVWALAWNDAGNLIVGTRKDSLVFVKRQWTLVTPTAPATSETADE